jgi:mycothione reductase
VTPDAAEYDLVIIGAGSGNSLVTPEMADWRIALVEQGTVGGTCLNVGCIPTKMYVYPADLARGVTEARRLGVDATLDRVHWRAIRDRIFARIDAIAAGGREYRAHGCANVTLYEAHAEFVGPRRLRLDSGQELTGRQVVVATGSRPWVPPLVAASGVPYHTSDTVMRIDDLPQRVAIIGGGYIGAEFAHIFSSFGAEVTVIARGDQIARAHDADIARALGAAMAERVDLRLGRHVTGVRGDQETVEVRLDDGSRVEAELLLVATGRVPNADAIGAAAGRLERRPDGRLVVDCYQRTTADGVWALGDVCSPFQLKHVANGEARVVAHNLAHPDEPFQTDHRFVPSAVFTAPQIASVGLTEAQAKARRVPYVISIERYANAAYGWAMEDRTGLCKLVADPRSGQLLGAHIIGEQAATLIQPLIQAMSFGLGVREMAREQYWIHPALSEVIENALLGLRLDG